MSSGGLGGNVEQSSPDVQDPGPRKAIDFNEQGDDRSFSKNFLGSAIPDEHCSSSGEAATGLLELQQGERYIQLPHMRLAVLHEKYWLAILHKTKLVDFRSGKCPILLQAGDCVLFALGVRYRKKGRNALVFARVMKTELLDVDKARETYPCEAEDCNLTDLAASWGVTSVYCIALEKDSIRAADEFVNLSRGCLGFVRQIAHDSGVPHFCHANDLGKTVSFTLPGGKIVHPC